MLAEIPSDLPAWILLWSIAAGTAALAWILVAGFVKRRLWNVHSTHTSISGGDIAVAIVLVVVALLVTGCAYGVLTFRGVGP